MIILYNLSGTAVSLNATHNLATMNESFLVQDINLGLFNVMYIATISVLSG